MTFRRAQARRWILLPAALLSVGWVLVGPPAGVAQDIVGNPQNGKAVYERHCLRCHGIGGHGDGPERERLIVPPADFHRFTTQTKSDEQLMMSIEFGLALSPMHGFAGRLTERERDDVLAYIRLLMRDH
jgi:mono/diheme cytochrome c family protein